MKLSDYVAGFLADHGARHIFLVTGGGAMHLNDSIGLETRLEYVCCHHEQACAMAAEGYARVSGKPGIVCVTTGPGGINALNGVFGAWTDSIPMLVISGQVKRETCMAACRLSSLRQLGDQEADIIPMVQGITKYSVMVEDPATIRYHLEKALHLAVSGRPGPCWVDIPLDVQGMPLPTLWALGNVRLMAVVAPFKLFLLMSVPVLFGLYFILHKVSLTARDRLIWCTLAAISYPVLFVATRGHLMAGMITVLLLAFVMLMYANTHQWLAFLLLAIVVNLRPNTVIFASLLLITQPRNIIRNCFFFGFTALAIFLCSFLLATSIYPDYTFENFSVAVSIYHATYVAGSAGLAYGSSLLGGLKVLFGYHWFFELGILAIGLVTLVAFSVLLHFGKLSRACYVFIVCALYALCPSVFGDYYLLIFIAPLLCLYLGSIPKLSAEASWSNSDLAIFLVSVLLLAPKNYVFMRGGVSPQVLINPMLLLGAVLFCLQQAYKTVRMANPLRG